ncbi:transcription termination/antitermination protein NusG [Nitrosococcus oceani]|uniref:Transcription termination/antitermination protein NusG n=2 Tax=Nitrosococcus oceani TaxID=1229 RepID=Q3J8Q2_NITOC|nr:transcription termination/antitermination protein NusG [Nitrosococcus oceani]KFI18772.1 antitermination protein NusG [Nitrosococcus oceani C-27]ABA58794.1 transcription antitermination protein nusG [Nitrosococcus oceani ATCC 19707]EDZ66838.1 transcription termination/antitermination factor NusG [Nitrosococcus oceani AFC27]KFI22015.1 antitermination protein NusG [Nitrosococcus oceani]GEM19116.1 transcription termination/antitermination protein NusG [Nitrosococcus oceani]
MAKRWYVVQAFSGFEQQVKRSIEERVRRYGLQESFGDILVPTEEVVEMREGQKRKSERKFFPGYVLVQMEMGDETWHLVKDVPRVLGFIGGTSDKPAAITEAEAEEILERIREGAEQPRPKVLFEPGEMVRVIEGPFTDFNGVVEEVNYEKNKLRVAVLIFGRSTPVELDFGQVEKR